MSERRAQRPEDRTRRDHKGHQQEDRFVKDRHPSLAYQRIQDDDSSWMVHSTPGARDCNCDPNRQHADYAPYYLDDFAKDFTPPIEPSPDGGAWGQEWAYEAGEGHTYDTGTWAYIDSPWFDPVYKGSGGWACVSGPAGWPDEDPPGCPTGPRWHMIGERYRELWFPLTVPAHPANAAGINMLMPTLADNANVFNDHTSDYSKVAGYQLRVAQTTPTARRSGALITTFLGAGVQAPPTLLIPIEHVPAEGNTIWIGFAPNWDTIPGGPGVCWGSENNINGQHFPVMAAQAFGSDGSVMRSSIPQWMSLAGGSFGNGNDGEDQGAWYAGNLPWETTLDGGSFDVSNGVLTFTGPGKLTMRMEGADTVITEPDEEDDLDLDEMGEPWTHEFGVRMGMRLKLDVELPDTDIGERGVTMRWNDHSGWVSTRLGFGDPTYPSGLRLDADGAEDSLGGYIEPDNWVCLWMDTRMVDVVRSRAWNEADPAFPWSGQTWRKLEVARDAFFDHEDDNAFEVIIEAGAGQVVSLDAIRVAGPGEDGQIVHEHAGSGDGIRIDYWASQPYYPGTMEFDVAGISVRAKDVDHTQGAFQSIDGLAVPDRGRMDLTYRVYREEGYGDDTEDPTEDDSADDPDYVAP